MDDRLFDDGELGLRTSHARVLMCIARDPGARLRDIAASLTGTAVQGQDRANLDQMACEVGE